MEKIATCRQDSSRNEILSANEIRAIIGMPSTNPKADYATLTWLYEDGYPGEEEEGKIWKTHTLNRRVPAEYDPERYQ